MTASLTRCIKKSLGIDSRYSSKREAVSFQHSDKGGRPCKRVLSAFWTSFSIPHLHAFNVKGAEAVVGNCPLYSPGSPVDTRLLRSTNFDSQSTFDIAAFVKLKLAQAHVLVSVVQVVSCILAPKKVS